MTDDDYLWNPDADAQPEIARLEAVLRPAAHRAVPLRDPVRVAPPRRALRRLWPAAAAAAILLALASLAVVEHRAVAPWSVSATTGTLTLLTASGAPAHGVLEAGGVLETGARTSARLAVGRIGRATLGPASRLRLLGAGPRQHLLALERGTMHARIDAPPRYFLVQTPSALAVDLGCAYTLSVDANGDGVLSVEEGEVELQQGDVKIAVLAGNSAALSRGGPGLPYPASASEGLRAAVRSYDAHPDSATLREVLVRADARSTITLWHLLQRAAPGDRGRVYDRLAAIAPPPASVTRERALRGDSGALQRWRTALQPAWIAEPPIWRRAWLALSN